jgi:3-hydroxyisobutyrate dehydrogenase-like beta-hydroxyacid dehydrogenase
MRVGYIGLGSQGGPIARSIIDAGYPTMLWARRAATLEPFGDTGAKLAATPAELAAASDLVCLCVVGDADVEQVFQALLPGIAAGAVIAVQSTVHPATCVRLAALAAARGATLIDAPVSGGAPAVAARQLVVMVGGERAVFERCRPVFATCGNPVVHVGPLGSGQLSKLVNNLLMTAHLALADDALALAASLGIDRAAFVEVVSRGSGSSFAFATLARLGSLSALAGVGADNLRKDVDIVSELARQQGARPGSLVPIADQALTQMGRPPGA